MKISSTSHDKSYVIRSYEAGQIIINQDVYSKSLILAPNQLIPGWRPQSVSELAAADFDELMGLDPGLIILGTGVKQAFPPPLLYAGILEKGIGMEIMNTPAACRTYNILMAEGRPVVAALMMV